MSCWIRCRRVRARVAQGFRKLNEELEDNNKEPSGEAHINARVLSGVVNIPTETVENNHQAEESMFESGAMAESVDNETSDAVGREDSDLNIDRPCELEHDSCVLSHPLSNTDSASQPDAAEAWLSGLQTGLSISTLLTLHCQHSLKFCGQTFHFCRKTQGPLLGTGKTYSVKDVAGTTALVMLIPTVY